MSPPYHIPPPDYPGLAEVERPFFSSLERGFFHSFLSSFSLLRVGKGGIKTFTRLWLRSNCIGGGGGDLGRGRREEGEGDIDVGKGVATWWCHTAQMKS